MNILHYFNDGASAQSKATLAFLQDELSNDQLDKLSQIDFGRWQNCREQGYVVSVSINDNQLNIAFFESRNSDSIVVWKWYQVERLNLVNLNTAILDDKEDHWLPFGQCHEMAEWIHEQINNFIKDNS
jgi:hypothetical protein